MIFVYKCIYGGHVFFFKDRTFAKVGQREERVAENMQQRVLGWIQPLHMGSEIQLLSLARVQEDLTLGFDEDSARKLQS